jgi:hypothetical protein
MPTEPFGIIRLIRIHAFTAAAALNTGAAHASRAMQQPNLPPALNCFFRAEHMSLLLETQVSPNKTLS